MYKIQNGTGTSLSITLEKGGIILRAGATYDLDGVCSRKWINSDTTLRYLITKKCIKIILDTEKNLNKSPIKDIAKADNLLYPTLRREIPMPSKLQKSLEINARQRYNKKFDYDDFYIKLPNTEEPQKVLSDVKIPEFRYKNDIEPVFVDLTKILEEVSKPLVIKTVKTDVQKPQVPEELVDALEPVVIEPVVIEPVVVEPVVIEPVVIEPVVVEPVVVEPVMVEPVVVESVVVEPVVEPIVVPVVKSKKRRGRQPRKINEN